MRSILVYLGHFSAVMMAIRLLLRKSKRNPKIIAAGGAGMTSTTEIIDKPARILVEDNEAGVRERITSALTTAGYECRVSETPMQTTKILKSGENVDLVLCGVAEWTEEDLKRI